MSPKADTMTNGSAAPTTKPATLPISATSTTCASPSATMEWPGAPRAFRIARLIRLRSIAALTALATPTPPTTSDVSPTNVRNCVKRSRLRSNSGETLCRVLISQPAAGNAALASATKRSNAASPVWVGPPRSMRVVNLVNDPGWINPEARRPSRLISNRGAKAKPPASLSGSARSHARRT